MLKKRWKMVFPIDMCKYYDEQWEYKQVELEDDNVYITAKDSARDITI